MSAVVHARGVGKRYRRGRERLNVRSLVPGRFGESRGADQHWALRDLSFDLEAGSSIGFIGGNGAGKSTTLKLVAGVVAPSEGSVEVLGRTTSLIELGAGFHPDMTGRENVYFSASVLGLGPKSLRTRLDDIIEFADIGRYLDTPVKRYSSGMLARLGFAVASHVDAELIVLDEVLAVGDASFQRKCHARIGEIRASGGALLYVTHALWTVTTLCDEAVLLADGVVAARGAPVDVVRAYERNHEATRVSSTGTGVVIHQVQASATVLGPGDGLVVQLSLSWDRALPAGEVGVIVAHGPGQAIATVLLGPGDLPFGAPGAVDVAVEIDDLPIQPGIYELYAVFSADSRVPVVDDTRRLTLEIRGREQDPTYGPVRLSRSVSVTPRDVGASVRPPAASAPTDRETVTDRMVD